MLIKGLITRFINTFIITEIMQSQTINIVVWPRSLSKQSLSRMLRVVVITNAAVDTNFAVDTNAAES
jgi:hypothetical protein